MEIRLTEPAKRFITISEMDGIKEIRDMLKEDDGLEIGSSYYDNESECFMTDTRFYGSYFVMMYNLAGGSVSDGTRIYDASAQIARNSRVWNAYGEHSGKLDVWLEANFYDPYDGFFVVGAYLTDIWNLSSDNATEIKSHMYIRHYVKEN